MKKRDIELGIERLKGIQIEISGLLVEAEGIVKECDEREWQKARPYWINNIEVALDACMEMWTMSDTILALEGLIE